MKPAVEKAGRRIVRASPRFSKQVRQVVDTILVEENSLFRVGLEYLLNETPFRVVARMDAVALENVPELSRTVPLLVILGSSGNLEAVIAFAREIKKRYPMARLACLRKSYDAIDMTSLLGSGVDGLLLRDSNARNLIKSLELIMAGESIFPQNLIKFRGLEGRDERIVTDAPEPVVETARDGAGAPDCILSARERDVLRLLVIGDSNKVIALKLAITEATVKVHVKGLLRKIQVQNRTQAAIWAVQNLPGG